MSTEGARILRHLSDGGPLESHTDSDLHDREQELLRRFERYPNYDIRTAAEVNNEHGVDILGDVIPRHLARLQRSGQDRPLAVLDLGCGLGIFTDQVRQRFGEAVTVYGTTLLHEQSQKTRANYVQRSDYIRSRLDLQSVLAVLHEIGPTMHANDGKWRSVREMQPEPEFDLMLDTYGELFYAGRDVYSQNYKAEAFAQALVAAIRKLRLNGELYIAQLYKFEEDFLKKHGAELREKFGIEVEQRQWHYTIRKVTE